MRIAEQKEVPIALSPCLKPKDSRIRNLFIWIECHKDIPEGLY